jgi:hypothetical protein
MPPLGWPISTLTTRSRSSGFCRTTADRPRLRPLVSAGWSLFSSPAFYPSPAPKCSMSPASVLRTDSNV